MLLCYDLSDIQSFERVEYWYQALVDANLSEDLPVVLLALKSDLSDEGKRAISENEGLRKKR